MKSKTTYSHAPTIAIIGAGLGCLSLARMMHVLGLQAAVYDKDRTASERSIGGSLDMHEETGLYAIRQAGLFDQFEQLARYEDQGMRLFHRDGDLLFGTHDQNRPEIDRGQLREMLLASIPPGWFHWDHDLQYVRESPAGGFDLLFRGGAPAARRLCRRSRWRLVLGPRRRHRPHPPLQRSHLLRARNRARGPGPP